MIEFSELSCNGVQYSGGRTEAPREPTRDATAPLTRQQPTPHLDARRLRPDLHIVLRVISRPENAVNEALESVSAGEFARRGAAGIARRIGGHTGFPMAPRAASIGHSLKAGKLIAGWW